MTAKRIIHLIAAARPNFMKIAPLYHALAEQPWGELMVIHTGQHYDLNMSDEIFEDLGLSAPDIHLGIGSGTHAEQTGRVMMAYEMVGRNFSVRKNAAGLLCERGGNKCLPILSVPVFGAEAGNGFG